jgi:hypothetical protein
MKLTENTLLYFLFHVDCQASNHQVKVPDGEHSFETYVKMKEEFAVLSRDEKMGVLDRSAFILHIQCPFFFLFSSQSPCLFCMFITISG